MLQRTLAIETSCDDTSVGIVSFDWQHFVVEKLVAFSQIALHQQYGGVVPELAYRSHADKIVRLVEELGGTEIQKSIDFISVTAYPGLPGALVVGVTAAHTLWASRWIPVIEVNHIMGHVFSVLVERSLAALQFPYLCLTVSGGHNDLYLVELRATTKEQWAKKLTSKHEQWIQDSEKTISWRHKRMHLAVGESLEVGIYTVTKLWQTVDDAAGEVFDKVARMLGGPYPGGAWIGQMADTARAKDPTLFGTKFIDDVYTMSFSGIKSQVHTYIEKHHSGQMTQEQKAEIARSFQDAVIKTLCRTLKRAINTIVPASVGIVGGVSANKRLQMQSMEMIAASAPDKNVLLFPEKLVYCTDNAAMIGVVWHLMTHRNDW